ncbi:PREDICTED: uncharacterized protein LOC109234226 isoform X2 [Nicotiana attenuata]|uniref:uncharacterized protein LOC109234226 isoform X2 n=1 Tax=Nicotiana attenuata TaxID=49451 RepID=UPI000905C7FF|nr:PREDICTED: uncharacterized protein LOC109234226 isoform X2 [Nicotiana attenuata]
MGDVKEHLLGWLHRAARLQLMACSCQRPIPLQAKSPLRCQGCNAWTIIFLYSSFLLIQKNAIVINEGGLVVSSLSPIVTKSHPQVNNQLQVFGATNQVMSNICFSTTRNGFFELQVDQDEEENGRSRLQKFN